MNNYKNAHYEVIEGKECNHRQKCPQCAVCFLFYLKPKQMNKFYHNKTNTCEKVKITSNETQQAIVSLCFGGELK